MNVSIAPLLKLVFVGLCAVASARAGIAGQSKPDPWQPVRFLAGTWQGEATGVGGSGTARRTYTFVLKEPDLL